MTATIDLTGLRERFRGEIITADDNQYDGARAIFNAMHDRRPAVIARATGAADVIAAVNFARDQKLALAVRGGGHSVAGYSTCDGGLVLDLGPMKGIRVDQAGKRVRAQAGLTWGELDRETQAFGLAVVGGRVSTTGVAGLTLGSGTGWLDRLYGLTSDNLVSADIVTADGKLLTASATENEDLFWGIRGGGGNFGVVTEFEFKAHSVGPTILGGLVIHSMENAPAVARFYREFMQSAPPELSGGCAVITAPPAPFIPAELHGKPVFALIITWFGDIARGEKLLSELRTVGGPVGDVVGPMPYVALQSMLDGGNAPGRRNYWRSDNLSGLPDDAIEALLARGATMTSPLTQLIVFPLGGAAAKVNANATANGDRTAPWQYHCYAVWTEGDDAKHIEWVRGTEQALKKYTAAGISVNFVSDAGNERVRSSFGEEKYQRLAALKSKYDPTNLFRLNQNIPPA